MGWTSYKATYYKNGEVDRLAQCREEFGREESWATILKDTMRGSIYYAAMKNTQTGRVWALIVKTSIFKGDFYYKDMSESELPFYYDCPECILKLLSPTENENAAEWRRLCRERANERRTREKQLAAVKDGAAAKVTICANCNYYQKGESVATIRRGRYFLDLTRRVRIPLSLISDIQSA